MSRQMRIVGPAVAALGIGTALLAGTAAADDGGRPFRLEMSGAQEFNNQGLPSNPHGDADRGTIKLTLNPGQEEVCWSVSELTLTPGEALPSAGHIHEAPAGIAGPVVVPLFGGAIPAPTSYPTGTACVTASRELILDIIRNPEAYYVNLHNNPPHPGGVVRAQLG